MYEQVIGWILLVLSFAGAFIGFGSQVIKNYREKRCGMALPFLGILVFLLIFRTWYSILKGAPFIFVPDIVGLLIVLVILGQAYHYRSSKGYHYRKYQ